MKRAADERDRPALAAGEKRTPGRDSPKDAHSEVEKRPSDDGTAEGFDDALAHARNLMSLLTEKKRPGERAGLTWEVGQKRATQSGAGGVWTLVEKHDTLREARAAARLRPNGVKFRSDKNSSTHWYYACATHAANGCPCVMRVSRPTHSGATGCWIVERRDGEQCDALANVPTEDFIKRASDDVVDCDGAPAIGVPPTKHCRDGHQRGVNRNLLPLISEMRKTGATPSVIVKRLHSAWTNGDLRGTITGKGDLPSQKQLKVRPLYALTNLLCETDKRVPIDRTSYIAW